MSEPVIFMMGKFEARFPTDRKYAKNHMWARAVAGGGYRCGFSAYAVRLLQDVYFLDWIVDAGSMVRERQEIGSIESSKAESALYAPMSGRLLAFQEALLADPSIINVDTYERGWLFAIDGQGEELLSPEAYLIHLEAAWKIAERTIKGQLND
ncbi:MAG: glycine cleavage system protein H [Pirellulales bacterium]